MTPKEKSDEVRKYTSALATYGRPFQDGTAIGRAYEEMKDGQFHDWSLVCERHSLKSNWLKKYLDLRGEANGLWRLEFSSDKTKARLILP
jgi:hypothetical protein